MGANLAVDAVILLPGCGGLVTMFVVFTYAMDRFRAHLF
jgi:hypothetical protein